MENTERVLFKNDKPQWYVILNEKWLGPLSAQEIVTKIQANEISWVQYSWKEKDKKFLRLCDQPVFSGALPAAPKKELLKNLQKLSSQESYKTPPPPEDEEDISKTAKGWFLYFNHGQFGPFTEDEIRRQLRIGRINPRVHGWRDGMDNWCRLDKIKELNLSDADTPTDRIKVPDLAKKEDQGPVDSRTIELRDTPRRPMVARILIANDRSVNVGICRDISVGGMQILTDQIPFQRGSVIRINVTPTEEGMFAPFVAEGNVVRVLEDRKGFSFRFNNLSAEAKKAIEKYIGSDE